MGHLTAHKAEDPGHMGVTVEANAPVDELEVGGRDRGVEDVFVYMVARARVN